MVKPVLSSRAMHVAVSASFSPGRLRPFASNPRVRCTSTSKKQSLIYSSGVWFHVALIASCVAGPPVRINSLSCSASLLSSSSLVTPPIWSFTSRTWSLSSRTLKLQKTRAQWPRPTLSSLEVISGSLLAATSWLCSIFSKQFSSSLP